MSNGAPAHKLHFIGRVECVADGCEPEAPTGFVPVPQSWEQEERQKQERRRPFIARRSAR